MPARHGWLRRMLGGAAWLAMALVVIALGLAAYVWVQLGRSLPQLDGTREIAGLSAPVTVARDALGVPAITGATRLDAARALGFVHAQDRFFQMDLSRRRAAGELSELFGRAALATDRSARLHRFRHRAAVVLAEGNPADVALLTAYVGGVNAGLESLTAVPFEYQVLRQAPRPWALEDSVLVVASMFFSLQDSTGGVEARAALLHEAFPAELAQFLNSTASDWDTPMAGDAIPAPTPPPAAVFDLRAAPPGATTATAASPARFARRVEGADAFAVALGIVPPDEDARGSNSWVVAGSRTADGRALLSNDMHLSLSVPNIWYRASIAWTDDRGPHQVTGVTLPGSMSVAVGSNGHIAWGFTNTTADWTDRVLIEPVADDPLLYQTPDGPRAFSVTREQIHIANEDDIWLDVRETMWGPVAAPDHAGRLFALAWVAHHPAGLNLTLSAMESVTTIEEAMAVANRAGIPGQNCVIADRQGQIGWTIAGRIPRRVGFDGSRPTSWADGSRRWDGWYNADQYPRILNPPSGVIVTANNRLVSGTHLAMLGDGGYDPGARARQILDGVRAVERATAADMLAVQLDDRALLMERWRALALKVLAADVSPARAEFRRLLQDDWSGRASVDSAGYRLARQFRLKTAELAFAPFVARLRALDESYPATPGRGLEGPVWAMVTMQPPHLLNPAYESWTKLLLGAVDETMAALTTNGRVLAERTWGEANTLTVQHPLSRGIPLAARWLDMPRTQLPGDSHLPRVQGATHGASERLTVSPGNEAAGYFHMGTGQSGHPRSPHYRDGHDAWAKGKATPFLPGPAVHTLLLTPAGTGER